jgi:subtilisin family serine protease
MKIKNLNNWISCLRYKFSKFGLNKYSVVKSSVSNDKNNWLVTNGNFDKTICKGEGEKVAVLDTGVDESHIEIINKIFPMSFIENCDDSYDYSNHGTFIVGEIISDNYGIAPKSTCLSAKVLHGDGRDGDLHAFEKNVVKAIQYACRNNYGVISMSFGSPHKSALLYDALEEAVSLGIIPIAAAGNEGLRGSPYMSYPASFNNCISVASANEHNLPAWYSTAGKGGTVCEQPEIAIASLNFHYGILPNNKYGKMTGTSISCPIVSGLALLWREKQKINNTMPKKEDVLKEFRQWLYDNAYDTNNNGWDNELGFGVLKLKPWETL